MARINQKGIDFIKAHEGLRLTAYYDSVGILTIGYGSARTFRGRPIYEGMTITEEEAELALIEEIDKHQYFLEFFTRGFNSNQIGALSSFEYNLGSGIWKRDNWNPNASDEEILHDMNLYRKPPEISGRRDDEIAFYKDLNDLDDNSVNPIPDNPNPDDSNASEAPSYLEKQFQQILKQFIEAIEGLLTSDIYKFTDSDNLLANEIVKVTKTYANTFKVKLLPNLFDTASGGLTVDKTPKPPQPTEPPYIPDGASGSETMQAIYNWCVPRLGQSFDFDGVYGAQCVDLLTTINAELMLGLRVSGFGSAKNIYINGSQFLPSDWTKVEGDVNNHENAKNIWNSLPNGCYVFFTGGSYGHCGVKSGDWCYLFNQNVDGTPDIGGPLRESNMASWVERGNGFLGAWVKY